MDYIRITNWDKFQHYKDRAPKWIKLYRAMLDDYEFTSLPDAAKGHLVCIWLLASALDNKIPADAKWIQNRIGASSKIDLKPLKSAGFIELYGNGTEVVQNAERVCSDSVPREEKRREETEGEKEAEIVFPPHLDNDTFKATFNDFKDSRKKLKAPMTDMAEQMLLNKLELLAMPQALACLKDAIMNGWKSVYPKNETTASANDGFDEEGNAL